MKATMTILAVVVAFATTAARAADLAEVKQAGLVGEQENGYLAAVQPHVPDEVKALVKDVNDKRRDRYRQIANDNGIPLQVVEERAGKTAIGKTRAGQYVREHGRWRVKRGD